MGGREAERRKALGARPRRGRTLARRVRDRRYGRTFIALYACDGRDVDTDDLEVASKFAKPVKLGRDGARKK